MQHPRPGVRDRVYNVSCEPLAVCRRFSLERCVCVSVSSVSVCCANATCGRDFGCERRTEDLCRRSWWY